MSIISFAGALGLWAAAAASKFGIDDESSEFLDATFDISAAAMIGDACLHLIPTFEGTDEETDRYGAISYGVVAVTREVCDACNTGTSALRRREFISRGFT